MVAGSRIVGRAGGGQVTEPDRPVIVGSAAENLQGPAVEIEQSPVVLPGEVDGTVSLRTDLQRPSGRDQIDRRRLDPLTPNVLTDQAASPSVPGRAALAERLPYTMLLV